MWAFALGHAQFVKADTADVAQTSESANASNTEESTSGTNITENGAVTQEEYGDAEDTDTTTQTTEDGEPGEEVGVHTGNEVQDSEDSAVIDTGNASSTLDAEQIRALNETTVVGADETEVTNTNDTEVSLSAEVTSSTGDNAATATGTVDVNTGTAMSTTNVLNVVNTNTFNAEGLFFFLNMLMGNVALDLRDLFSILTTGMPSWNTPSACAPDDTQCVDERKMLTIHNQNKANVSTDLTVGASTAQNTAFAGQNAGITTGDAYAGANVINVVNTNITDANYLLLTVNSFGSGNGDIVFPGADWFYELLRASSGIPTGSVIDIDNDNLANVLTEIDIEAGTGDNDATAPLASIQTGSAVTSTNVVDRVNTNIFGDSISLLFRVSGEWSGNIYGLPEGMSWRETPVGVEIYLDGTLDTGNTSDFSHPFTLTNTNKNEADVRTKLNVFALTGDNMAEAGEVADITTGNAEAGANVMNIVNTNVLGRNWVLAIFNIVGDWGGNIAFGQPDLWVGARAVTPSLVRSGSCFTYEVTVNNLGDAVANDVYITGRYDTQLQQIEGMEEMLDGRMRLHVGRILAGDTRTITLPSCLSRYVGSGTSVDTVFDVEGIEPDADPTNNTDVIRIVTTSFGGGGGLLRSTTAATQETMPTTNLTVTKTADKESIVASSSVEYTVTIENDGAPIHYALLVDVIYDAQGKAIHEQRWGLETIQKNETIVISYSAFFNASTSAGTYVNTAFVSGTLGTLEDSPVASPVASVEVEVLEEEGMVLGITDEARVCQPILTEYIRYGSVNDPLEVSKLQYFLRAIEKDMSVPLSSEYDRLTHDAVHNFQRKYADDILSPWGTAESTGFVYHTTQKKINELWCVDRKFPLAPEQVQEISVAREHVGEYQGSGIPARQNRASESVNVEDVATPSIEVSIDSVDQEQTGTVQTASAAQASDTKDLWGRIKGGLQSAFSFLRD